MKKVILILPFLWSTAFIPTILLKHMAPAVPSQSVSAGPTAGTDDFFALLPTPFSFDTDSIRGNATKSLVRTEAPTEKTLHFIGGPNNARYTDQVGSNTGDPFEFLPPAGYSRVRAILVYSDRFVEGLQLEWELKDGRIVASRKIGTVQTATQHVVDFDKGEYIQSIEGKYGNHIDHLLVRTNKRDLKFGGTGGTVFYCPHLSECRGKGVEVIGLVGKFDNYINALGIIGKCR